MLIYVAPACASLAQLQRLADAGHAPALSGSRDPLPLLRRCDALLVPSLDHPDTRQLCAFAQERGIPVYTADQPIPLPLTEERCPIQVRAFLDIVMTMYRVHLSKNADYSPANILVPGELGLITRLWDKVARLLSLAGFRFEVTSAGQYEAPRSPKHESIDDTLLDLSVYGVIGLLLRRNEWGK